MTSFTCSQHGCAFEAKKAPKNCPVCNNPFLQNSAGDENGDAGDDWNDYTLPELRELAREWGLEAFSGLRKAELISELKALEDA